MAIRFQENYYSFRVPLPEQSLVLQQGSGVDSSTLAQIQQALTNANNLYNQRQYQAAIDAYLQLRALIFGLLFPVPLPPVGPWKPPIDKALFGAILSAGLEIFNIVPPNPGDPGPVSRDQVNFGDFGDLQLGLHTAEAATPAGQSSTADLKLASVYSKQGNEPAAQFFLARAEKTSPKTVQALVHPIGGSETQDAAAVRAAPRLPQGPFEVKASPTADRVLTTLSGKKQVSFTWKAGQAAPVQEVTAKVYQARTAFTDAVSLIPVIISQADLGIDLPHIYYYVIPLGLAECYQALGDWKEAETEYFAAADYTYINPTIEVPYVWQRLASLYSDWGDSLFRDGDAVSALPVYENVLMPDDGAPGSRLYTEPSLAPAVASAKTLLQHLDAVLADPTQIGALGLNPVTASIVIHIKEQLLKLQAGLDFWGHWAQNVPIWTFDYLQSVAINFAQLAINAEKDVIAYWDRADQGQLTRLQLTQQVSQSQAEVNAAQLQADAAAAEETAYSDGVTLAQQRAADAQANRNDYANLSAQQIVHQALAAQLSGGDDGDADQLNQLADQMTSGPYSIDGSRATLSAAEQLSAARMNRDYELNSMQREADELNTAATQAQDELTAAQARTKAAQAGVAVAQARQQGAQQTLQAFDDQFFTPDVWQRMGDAQWQIYQRYLSMALAVAKKMQAAYNFETDQTLSLIRSDYSSDTVNGLLGADQLMADVQSFTYDLVTSTRPKPQPVKQTISLANRYPYLFETAFRLTGTIEFQTDLDDFDSLYPGTYAGRIQAVEVAVDGIVPPTGISGTLENDGISAYRMPADAWAEGDGLKYRVQNKETLVLSDYEIRNDDLEQPANPRMLRIFEGAGLVSTWTLNLPPSINDIDYGALTDVRLTFYYQARFDPTLRNRVLATLATRPGYTSRQRGIPMRWLYPDAFFHFQDTGKLVLTLKKADFRTNETNPVITDIGVQLTTDGSVAPGGLIVQLATPAHPAAIGATLAADGTFSSTAVNGWAPLAAGTALGDYKLTMTAADNPGLVQGGDLALSPVINVAIVLGYIFTPRA
jgi:hypothetical protein